MQSHHSREAAGSLGRRHCSADALCHGVSAIKNGTVQLESGQAEEPQSKSVPLDAMHFLYQKKESLRRRSKVPLPALS